MYDGKLLLYIELKHRTCTKSVSVTKMLLHSETHGYITTIRFIGHYMYLDWSKTHVLSEYKT